MFLIYYCCLVDYAIRLTCKCIVFFRKERTYSPYFSTIVIAAIEKYGILKVLHAKLSVWGFYFHKK